VWPPLATGALAVVFVGFLTEAELAVAGAGTVLFLGAMAGWHRRTEAPSRTRR
jgi:hypothetical protein